jgi:hypothetical protein
MAKDTLAYSMYTPRLEKGQDVKDHVNRSMKAEVENPASTSPLKWNRTQPRRRLTF